MASSPVVDNVNVWSLEDWIDNPLKVYVYQCVGVNKYTPFLASNSFSIVKIQNQSNNILKYDKDGKGYIGVIPQATEGLGLTNASVDTTLTTLEKEISINIFANSLPFLHQNETVEAGMLNLLPYIFTIGKPFDQVAFENQGQQVFMLTNVLVIHEGSGDENDVLISEGYQEATLTNINEIIKNVSDSGLTLIETDVDYVNNVEKIDLMLPYYSMLSMSQGVVVEGIDENQNYYAPETITKNGLMPFKMSPIDTTNNMVTLYADWHDNDVVLPPEVARVFINNVNLFTLLKKEVKECLADMLAIMYAYSNQFKDFKREEDKNNPNFGQLLPDQEIGYAKYNIITLRDNKVNDILSFRYNKFIIDNMISANDPTNMELKQFIASLSNYIGGNLSIGSFDPQWNMVGTNFFHQSYLPYYLWLSTSLSFSTSKDGDKTIYKLNESVNAQLRSNYFVFEPWLSVKKDTILSEVINIQTDRKVSLPSVPNEIPAIDKLPLPNEIDTRTSDNLRFGVLLPFNDPKIVNNILNLFRVLQEIKRINYTTWLSEYGVPEFDAQQTGWIPKAKNEIAKIYNTSTENVVIDDIGEAVRSGAVVQFRYSEYRTCGVVQSTCERWKVELLRIEKEKENSLSILSHWEWDYSITSELTLWMVRIKTEWTLHRHKRINVIATLNNKIILPPTSFLPFKISNWNKFIVSSLGDAIEPIITIPITKDNINDNMLTNITVSGFFIDKFDLDIQGQRITINWPKGITEPLGRLKINFT